MVGCWVGGRKKEKINFPATGFATGPLERDYSDNQRPWNKSGETRTRRWCWPLSLGADMTLRTRDFVFPAKSWTPSDCCCCSSPRGTKSRWSWRSQQIRLFSSKLCNNMVLKWNNIDYSCCKLPVVSTYLVFAQFLMFFSAKNRNLSLIVQQTWQQTNWKQAIWRHSIQQLTMHGKKCAEKWKRIINLDKK